MSRPSPIAIGFVSLLLLVGEAPRSASAQSEPDPGQTPEAERTPPSPFAVSFGGQYRVVATASNADFHLARVEATQPAISLVNQRLRPWVNLHDRGDRRHGAYLQLEIGHTPWGDDREFPKTHPANGDEVGLELRRGYLWLKPTQTSLLRAGVLDWHDRFGERPTFEDPQWAVDAYDSFQSVLANSIWDFEVGGVTFDATMDEAWHLGLAALLLQQDGRTLGGDGSAFLLAGDIDREFGAALLGASVYVLRDSGDYSYGTFGGPADVYESSWGLWAGVRGHLRIGRIEPSFFVIMNTGRTRDPDWTHTGWATKGALKMALAGGTLAVQALSSSGDDGTSSTRSGEFRTIAQSVRDDFGAQGYWSLLGLTSPRGPSDVIDLGVGLQNRGLGLMTVQAGFERPLSRRMSGYLATGYLRSAERTPVTGATALGTEFLAELRWTVARAMAVDIGASYLTTGDFYRRDPSGAAPAGLYQIYTRYQLEF